MRLFYLIWVDAILRAKSQPANKNDWQVMTFIYMSVIMAVDLLFIVTILEQFVLGYSFYELKIPGIHPEIGDPFSFAILFAGPPSVLNYVLIFRNRRYEKLIKKYEYHNGKLAVTYMLIGLFVPFIALVLAMIYDII
jgi:hypothetical protein